MSLFAYIPNQLSANISVIRLSDNTVVGTISFPGGKPTAAAVNPVRALAYITSSILPEVAVINTTNNTLVTTIGVGNTADAVAVNPTGTRVYVANRSDDTISVIDTDPLSVNYNTVIDTIAVPPVGGAGQNPAGLIVNPSGTILYVANILRDNVATFNIAADANTHIGNLTVGTQPKGIVIHPSGALLYVTNEGSDSVSVISTSSFTIVNTISVPTNPVSINVNSAGTRLYVGCSGGGSNKVAVINTAGLGSLITSISGFNSPTGISVTPDNSHVYVINSSGNNVLVIRTSDNTIQGSAITVGTAPGGFGSFITANANANYEIIQGYINSATSISTGTLKDINGVDLGYSDGTLSARGIQLSPGEKIIGRLNSSTSIVSNIVKLKPIFDKINGDLNVAENEITSSSITTALRNAKCCAVRKAAAGLTSGEAGCCEEDESKLRNMLNMADSIKCIIPEGEIVSGDQATYEIIVNAFSGTKSVTLSIGSANYSFTSTATTDDDFATDIAAAINNYYPQNYSYYAIASGQNVVIAGNAFDADNGTAVTGSTTNGLLTLDTPEELFGGTEPVYQGQNAISNNDIQIILTKLCQLCKN